MYGSSFGLQLGEDSLTSDALSDEPFGIGGWGDRYAAQ
jgi:hypothetical protein